MLTFQGHVKTSEETESRSSSKLLRVSLGAAETYIYIRNIVQISKCLHKLDCDFYRYENYESKLELGQQ